MTLDGDAWPTLGEGGVPALWDQIPEGAKWQIIAAIGCLEWYDEWQYDNPAAEMPAMADKPKHERDRRPADVDIEKPDASPLPRG